MLLDSVELKKEKLYTLYFFPRRAGDLAFTGNFTVSAPSFALTQINMRIDPNINLNLVSDLIIEKTYIIKNDSVYLPKSNHYEGDFSVIKKKKKGKELRLRKVNFLISIFSINQKILHFIKINPSSYQKMNISKMSPSGSPSKIVKITPEVPDKFYLKLKKIVK